MSLPNQINRERSISVILINTLHFVKLHWKPLLRLYLIFCPVFVIPGLVYSYLHPAVVLPHLKSSYSFENELLKHFTEDALIKLLLASIALTATAITCLTYIKLYMQDGVTPSAKTIFDRFKLSYIPYYIAIVLTQIVVNSGLLLLAVPGIYLIPITCLAIAAMILESLSPQEAIRRSFVLIKNNWWLTFGVIICTGLVILIPVLLIERTINHFVHLPLTKTIFRISFVLPGQFLLVIFNISLAFCYYALKASQPQTESSTPSNLS